MNEQETAADIAAWAIETGRVSESCRADIAGTESELLDGMNVARRRGFSTGNGTCLTGLTWRWVCDYAAELDTKIFQSKEMGSLIDSTRKFQKAGKKRRAEIIKENGSSENQKAIIAQKFGVSTEQVNRIFAQAIGAPAEVIDMLRNAEAKAKAPTAPAVAKPAAVEEPAPAKGKQAWEMTKAENARAKLDTIANKPTVESDSKRTFREFALSKPLEVSSGDIELHHEEGDNAFYIVDKTHAVDVYGFKGRSFYESTVENGSILATVIKVGTFVHELAVKDAIAANKPVPPAVLTEYASEEWAKAAIAKAATKAEHPEVVAARLAYGAASKAANAANKKSALTGTQEAADLAGTTADEAVRTSVALVVAEKAAAAKPTPSPQVAPSPVVAQPAAEADRKRTI